MKKIVITVFLTIFLLPVLIYAQGTGFIPPSPQSFSFIKATNVVSENEHTGSANVNIPLFTYKANKLNTDVSILYSGAGVKVDDLPNDTGMTWIVNAGGVVTRTVNGLADEQATMRMNKSEAELIQKTASDCAADEEIRTACYTPSQMDTERDIFDFRFGNVSGSFYLDQNFVPVFLKNDDDVRIKNILPPNETNNRKFIGFEITTKEGVKYVFGGSVDFWETTASKAMPANPPGDYATTSFFLKEIQNINGEKIFFAYENTTLVTNSISEIHTRYLYSCCLNTGIMPDLDPELRTSVQTHYTKNKKRIKTISNSETSDTISFIYSDKADSEFQKYLSQVEYRVNNEVFKKAALNYLFEDPIGTLKSQRFYLTQISFYNKNVFEKKYQFNYDNPLELPRRLTYGQDMYGYFNGQGNESLIAGFFGNTLPPSLDYPPSVLSTFGNRRPDFSYASKATLKEVVYPTGGKTKFEYEAPKTKAVFKTKVIMGENPFAPNGTETRIVENLHFNQNISFSLTTYSGDQSPNHMKQAYFSVKDLDTNQLIYSGSKTYGYAPQDSINGSFNALKDKRYLLTLTPNGNAEVKFSYSHRDPIDNFGIRLKSVTHSENGQNSEYKRFYYQPIELYKVKEEDLALQDMAIFPTTQYATFDEFHENMSLAVTYSAHISNNTSALYNSRLQERYSFVTASIGGDNFENGGYQKNFRKDSDDPLIMQRPASAGGNLAGPASSGSGYFGTVNGLPNFFGVILNSLYFPAKGNRLSFSGTLNKIKYFIKKNNVIYKNKQIGYQSKYNITATNANLFVSQPFRDLTYGNCGSSSVQRIANFYISIYKNYTVDTKPEKETVTDYIDGVPLTLYNNYDDYFAVDSLNSSEAAYRKLITITNYEYSGMPMHVQLTKQRIAGPDDRITETTYSYAHEKNNQLMISKNMIGIPLETTTTQTIGGVSKTLGKTETVYPTSLPTSQAGNLVLPLSSVSYDVLTNAPSTEVSYDKYDDKGNLLQYTGKDGIPVSIIWGYNRTQPIAKVEGMAYDQLTAAVSIAGIITASDNDAADPTKEGLLLDALNTFRKEPSLSGKLISTYTYDPLIGVTSITPPSGVRQTYTYDAANRLKEGKVRGKDTSGSYINKKVSENNYNYKP
ncbi:hypothetical protein [uncultured Chryseobacterium sp.]|uniref:hypothetical protein n=1 Tax=uncultured Chryseobacterium sp. TaxID=259322 RepID=UPI0025D536FA|nr:hypothetical protein [uncultured Chryseobacterium sp.]